MYKRQVDDVQSNLQWDLQGGWAWQANTASSGTQVTVDSNTVLPYTAYVIEPALRYATCSITGSVDSVRAECTVANGTQPFSYTVILIDDEGKMLDSTEGNLDANTTSGQVNLSANSWDPQPGMRSLVIRLLDERGIVIASDETEFEIRRNDWNIGLVALELDGQGDTQKIKVLTKREYHHLLTDADCSILVIAGSHTASHEIDFSGTYPPEPKLDRPSLDDAPDGTEIIVTVQCKFPWDVDSDPTDNEAKLILSGGSVNNDSGFEWFTAIGSAILVISLALTLTWILYNQRERKKLLDMTESILSKKKQETKLPKPPLPSENLVEENIQENTIIENEENINNQIVEDTPEVVERQLDDFESRLKRLTGDD